MTNISEWMTMGTKLSILYLDAQDRKCLETQIEVNRHQNTIEYFLTFLLTLYAKKNQSDLDVLVLFYTVLNWAILSGAVDENYTKHTKADLEAKIEELNTLLDGKKINVLSKN